MISSLSQCEFLVPFYLGCLVGFSLVFVFLCTSFVFVLPLGITPLLWVLAWLDMMRVLWGCEPS